MIGDGSEDPARLVTVRRCGDLMHGVGGFIVTAESMATRKLRKRRFCGDLAVRLDKVAKPAAGHEGRGAVRVWSEADFADVQEREELAARTQADSGDPAEGAGQTRGSLCSGGTLTVVAGLGRELAVVAEAGCRWGAWPPSLLFLFLMIVVCLL